MNFKEFDFENNLNKHLIFDKKNVKCIVAINNSTNKYRQKKKTFKKWGN